VIPAQFMYLAAVINSLAFLAYVVTTLTGLTQPNRVSWGIWAATAWLAFLGQLDEGVGAPALLTLSAAAGPGIIFVASFVQLKRSVSGVVCGLGLNRDGCWRATRLDWLCASLSLGTLLAWQLTASGNVALALSIAVDLLAGIPTIVKAYTAPETEAASAYLAGAVSAAITLLALDAWRFSSSAFAVYYLALSTTIAILVLRG
jgi:hypothetical protein